MSKNSRSLLQKEANEVNTQRLRKWNRAIAEHKTIDKSAYAMLRLTMQAYIIAEKLNRKCDMQKELDNMEFFDSLIHTPYQKG